MTVGKVIYNILANDIDVSGLVGTRIYPNSINYDSTTMPAVVYTETDNDPTNTKSTVSQLDQINILISCFAETYSQADDLAIKVRKAFESNYGTEETNSEVQVQSIEFVESQDMFDDDFGQWGINYKQLNFKVRIKRTLTSPDCIMVFDTRITDAQGSDENTLILPFSDDSANDCVVDWGDGTTQTINSGGNVNHTYSAPGIYKVTFSGNSVYLKYDVNRDTAENGSRDCLKLIEIKNWGIFNFANDESFKGCMNMTCSATDYPTITTTSFRSQFHFCHNFNPPSTFGDWDVSGVNRFDSCFSFNIVFNCDINSWDVSNCTAFYTMFYFATSFNQDLNSWDVSNSTGFSSMFSHAMNFNGDVSSWQFNESANISFSYMFNSAKNFNQDVSNWNVGRGIDFQGMFYACTTFNQNVNSWDMSNATSVYRMFYAIDQFDQPLNNWDVTNITSFGDFLRASDGYSTANYDSLLISWGAQDVSLNESINFGGSQYTAGGAAEAARTFLITNKGWTITDGGAA